MEKHPQSCWFPRQQSCTLKHLYDPNLTHNVFLVMAMKFVLKLYVIAIHVMVSQLHQAVMFVSGSGL